MNDARGVSFLFGSCGGLREISDAEDNPFSGDNGDGTNESFEASFAD